MASLCFIRYTQRLKNMPTFLPRGLAQINGGIYGIAGYYSDYSNTQHVIIANWSRELYEIHWNRQNPLPSSPRRLGQCPRNLVCLAGFVSPNDGYQHIVYATSDGRVYEVAFTREYRPQPPLLRASALNVAGTGIGIAGFFSTNDNCGHAVVVDTFGRLNELIFRQQRQSLFNSFPARWNNIASIAGFYASHNNTRHIIVALKDRRVFDVHYDDRQESASVTFLATCPGIPTIVAAFFTPDTNSRHVIVRTQDRRLIGYSYNRQGTSDPMEYPQSRGLNRVVDIAAYYSPYDGNRHLVIASPDGKLSEIVYSRQ